VRPARLRLGSGLLLGLALGLAGACDLTQTPGTTPDAGAPDAAPPPADAAPDATPICDYQEPYITGHHAERYGLGGAGCLGQCHNGQLGPTFTAAGSVFNRRTGGVNGAPAGSPVAGAIVYVIDSNGKVVAMTTSSNGEFYTSEPLAMPIRTYATACPDSIPMVDSTVGNCNLGACHGEDNKIYLPSPPLPPPL
jgi:hypothetical protein